VTVKTRRQGNSIMVTIPASFNIGENVEFEPIKDENGVISLLPVRHNIYTAESNYDLRKAMEEENIGDNGTPVGREDIWND
jgi:antitoxin MazE